VALSYNLNRFIGGSKKRPTVESITAGLGRVRESIIYDLSKAPVTSKLL
jgi:hypothetical protein